MRRADTIPAAAKVIQLEPRRDSALFSLVIKSMRGHQPVSFPEPRVAILLNDGEKPALRLRIDHDIGFVPIAPLRNFGVVPNAAAILFLRANLHMIGVAAISDPAKVVKSHVVGNRAETLLPIPTMCKPKPSIAPDATVTVDLVGREFPAAGSSIDNVLVLPTMAGEVHLRCSRDVSKTVLRGNRCFEPAPAHAKATAKVSNATHRRCHGMPLDVSGVAPFHQSFAVIGGNCGLSAALTEAQARWIRAARVVGLNVNCFPVMRQSAIVALQEAPLCYKRLAASASAKRCIVWRNGPRLSAARPHLVAVDEPSAARKSAVGAVCDLSAPAFAKLARIDLGHLTSLLGLWSAGTGVHALGQPFDCNRCRVEVA